MALKNMIKVGDKVTFGRSGEKKLSGKVVKCNPKTARIRVPRDGEYDVTYSLIQKKRKSTTAKKKPTTKRPSPTVTTYRRVREGDQPGGKGERAAELAVKKVLDRFEADANRMTRRKRQSLLREPIIQVTGKAKVIPYWALSDDYGVRSWLKDGSLLSFGVIYLDPRFKDDFDGGWTLEGWNSDTKWPARWFVKKVGSVAAMKAVKKARY